MTSAMTAVTSAVTKPITATAIIAVSDVTKIGYSRATRNTPATTIVAACIRALTGVGPSIASGSHTCSGNCADLPIAPRKMSSAETVSVPESMPPCSTTWKMAEMSNVPVSLNRSRMPISRPTSPIRVVTNAFFAASAADRLSYQKPMSR